MYGVQHKGKGKKPKANQNTKKGKHKDPLTADWAK
jgi:hypothetical protein